MNTKLNHEIAALVLVLARSAGWSGADGIKARASPAERPAVSRKKAVSTAPRSSRSPTRSSMADAGAEPRKRPVCGVMPLNAAAHAAWLAKNHTLGAKP